MANSNEQSKQFSRVQDGVGEGDGFHQNKNLMTDMIPLVIIVGLFTAKWWQHNHPGLLSWAITWSFACALLFGWPIYAAHSFNPFILVGAILNGAVMAVNHGRMPVVAEGFHIKDNDPEHVLAHSGSKLLCLADRFCVIGMAISLGDIAVGLGIAYGVSKLILGIVR